MDNMLTSALEKESNQLLSVLCYFLFHSIPTSSNGKY